MSQEPDTQPGDYFVSAVDQTDNTGRVSRHWLLSGPYQDHAAALSDVAAVRKISEHNEPRSVFYAFGTCRYPAGSGKIGSIQRIGHTVAGLLGAL